MTWNQTRKRKCDVARRAEATSLSGRYCRIIGCERLVTAAQNGLNARFCRIHADHLARHGDPLKRSYSASELNPYRRAVFDWLTLNAGGFWPDRALKGVLGLYQRAGYHEEAFRLRGLSPRQRGNVAWARLRVAGVDPRIPAAAWLGVVLAIENDSQQVWRREFRIVQAAKVVHRLASGTHKRWPGRELHVYPKSRGRVLRYIGSDLEKVMENLTHYHFEEVLVFCKARLGSGLAATRPHPRSASVRSRKRA